MEDFEKNIKKHFQERHIKPSENAWDRMEALINAQDSTPKKQTRFKYWMPIAASIALFIGIWMFFKPNATTEVKIKNTEKYVNTVVKPNPEEELHQKITQEKAVVQHKIKNKATIDTKKYSTKVHETEYVAAKEPEQYIANVVEMKKDKETVTEKPINTQIATVQNTPTQIYVNPNKLLRVAEMERQVDNTATNGQNFWRKVKEVNTVVQNVNK